MAAQDQDLHGALDRLFGAELDEFTRTRDALAKELRRAGNAAAAQTIAACRKPAVPAWAVNQLPRRAPARFQGLLDAGERLRRSQLAALAGKGTAELEAAVTEERQLVANLTGLAGRILQDAGHSATSAHLEAIRLTLSAAAGLPEEERAAVEHGRLERPVAPAGFGDLLAGALPVRGLAAPREARAPRARDREAREGPKPGEREAKRRRELQERAARAREADEAAGKAARQALDRALKLKAQVEHLRGQLDSAERAAEAATAESRRASQEAEAATRRRRQAEAESTALPR